MSYINKLLLFIIERYVTLNNVDLIDVYMSFSTVATIQKLVDKLGTSEDKSQLQSKL